MNRPRPRNDTAVLAYRYRPPDIPLRAIRGFARRIAELFDPDKIILFGSFAYGHPHADSDVDLLVVMPAADEVSQAVRISLAFEPVFPLDLIVRTPERLERRLGEGDWFLREVVEKGKVLYAKGDRPVGAKGRRRPPGGARRGRRQGAD